MQLYLENGYLNIEEIARHPSWLKVIIGARQIGKTYGTLLYHLQHTIPHILLRRTTDELDMITGAETNPYKVFEPEYHTAIFKAGKFLSINDYDENGAKLLPARGISFEEIPRMSEISAGNVRKLIDAGELDKVRELVPETTYEVIQRRSRADA